MSRAYRKLVFEDNKEAETSSSAIRKWFPKDRPSEKGNPFRNWLRGGKKKPETAAEDQTPLADAPSSSQQAASRTLGSVFHRPIVDLRTNYTVHKKLGKGSYGFTWLVKDKSNNQFAVDKSRDNKFACKSIVLDQLGRDRLPDVIRNEVEILHYLTGHPNIVKLKEVVEDEKAVHLIMDLGKGGTLLSRRDLFGQPTKKQSALKKLFKSKPYPEEEAKEMFRHIATAIHDCHKLGVIHRDVKPGNLVFSTKKDSPLMLIDFGLSVFHTPGEMFEEMIGSPPYIAPEVVDPQQHYGPKADIWSAGVILYTLLGGVVPFWPVTADKLPEAISQSNFKDYDRKPWDKISNNAKDLLRSMLTEDQEARISAADILNHPWLREAGLPDAPREIPILGRIQQFHAMSKFRRVAMKVIAATLFVEEAEGLRKLLKSFKSPEISNGITFEQGLSYDELKGGLYRLGAEVAEDEMDHLVNSVDVDSNWIIDQTEFIAATMHLSITRRYGRLFKAFLFFDKNNDGFITTEDMEQALGQSKIESFERKEIIAEVYRGEDREISYSEFEDMMRN